MLDRIGRLRHGGRLATGRRTAQQRASRIPDQNAPRGSSFRRRQSTGSSQMGCGTPPASVTRSSERPENAMASLRETKSPAVGPTRGRTRRSRERLSSGIAQRPHQDPAGSHRVLGLPAGDDDCPARSETGIRPAPATAPENVEEARGPDQTVGRTPKKPTAPTAADDEAGKGRDPGEPRRDPQGLAWQPRRRAPVR